MATGTSIRARRRPLRAAQQVHHPAIQTPLSAKFMRLALSPAAKTAYVIVGTAGLAALAVAVVGPKRLERDVLKPLRGTIEPQAEKLWAEARPLREQISALFHSAPPTGRERLIKSFQSWIGHFHAS